MPTLANVIGAFPLNYQGVRFDLQPVVDRAAFMLVATHEATRRQRVAYVSAAELYTHDVTHATRVFDAHIMDLWAALMEKSDDPRPQPSAETLGEWLEGVWNA